MAYMSQEMKKMLAPRIKSVLKKYGVKGTIGVENYSTLRVRITKGGLDFVKDVNDYNREYCKRRGLPEEHYHTNNGYIQVNEYSAVEHATTPEIANFYEELIDAMNGNYEGAETSNYDRSDIMTDYFDVGWYISIRVGNWNKPYILEA